VRAGDRLGLRAAVALELGPDAGEREQHNLILPALTVVECERHWTESRLFGALFGIAPTDLPADWASFVGYNEAMAQSDTRWG
jgi:uncharacterized protein (DUF2236 family)